MKFFTKKYSILLAAISGVLTAFTFPTMFSGVMLSNLGFLAWFSLIPLFVAIYNAGIRRTFGLAFITGFICYSISFYWIYNAITRYGKLSPLVTIAILFLMMVILGAYLAVIPAWVKWVRSKWNIPSLILLPVAWVAVELARNYFPAGGFSWNNIAYSQWNYPILIQTADLFSIYGITFLIILVNQLLAELIISISCHCEPFDSFVLRQACPERVRPSTGSGRTSRRAQDRLREAISRRHLLVKIISVILLLSMSLAYGWYRLETVNTRSPAVKTARIALIQGNIPQDEKWDYDLMEENATVYRSYMKWIKDSDVDLAIWPESAYPYMIPLDLPAINTKRLGLNPENDESSWLLFGALSIDMDEPETTLYNSAILVDNFGRIRDRYHKGHLVPFGEYVPYRKLLFFAEKLVAPVGDFMTGEGYNPILVRGEFKIGPLICYEDVFPEISRAMVLNGANILVNLTNDAWYGWTSAADQHLAISVFRSVENRRYMLRVTNSGVTAVIDPKGRIELRSDLFSRSFMISGIPILDGLTVYDKIGDLFAYVCALVVLLLSAMMGFRGILKK